MPQDADQKLESLRRACLADLAAFQFDTCPAMVEAEQWLRDHTAPSPLHQRLEIPVPCLPWTHASMHAPQWWKNNSEWDCT